MLIGSIDIALKYRYSIKIRHTYRYSGKMKFPKRCFGTWEPLNLHKSGLRATPELFVAPIDVKFRALSPGNAPEA